MTTWLINSSASMIRRLCPPRAQKNRAKWSGKKKKYASHILILNLPNFRENNSNSPAPPKWFLHLEICIPFVTKVLRKAGAQNLLRIEDPRSERATEEYVQDIIWPLDHGTKLWPRTRKSWGLKAEWQQIHVGQYRQHLRKMKRGGLCPGLLSQKIKEMDSTLTI